MESIDEIKKAANILHDLEGLASGSPQEIAIRSATISFKLISKLTSILPLIIKDINTYHKLSVEKKKSFLSDLIIDEFDSVLKHMNENIAVLANTDIDEIIFEGLKKQIKSFVNNYTEICENGSLKFKKPSFLCCF